MPDVPPLNTFSNTPPNTNVIDADPINSNFTALRNAVNDLDNDNIAAAAAIALSKLAITPMARVTHNADQTVSTSGTVLAFNTESFDTNAIHDTATNNSRLTCKTAGVYRVWFHGEYDPASAADTVRLQLRSNGSTVLAGARHVMTTDTAEGLPPLYTEILLAVNDYVEVVATAIGSNGTMKTDRTAFGMSFISRAS
jgi:hypothetical protein